MIKKAKENYEDIRFVKDACDFSFEEKFDAAFFDAALHWISIKKMRCNVFAMY